MIIIRYTLYRRLFGVFMNIEEIYDKIYRFCFYKVRNQQTAEDITQEVFLRFLRSEYKDDGTEISALTNCENSQQKLPGEKHYLNLKW